MEAADIQRWEQIVDGIEKKYLDYKTLISAPHYSQKRLTL